MSTLASHVETKRAPLVLARSVLRVNLSLPPAAEPATELGLDLSPAEQRIAGNARGVLAVARNKTSARIAANAVRTLVGAAVKLGVSELPPLFATEDEDGTLFISWMFPGRRLGITIDADPRNSGWHYVSAEVSANEVRSGDIENMDADVLLRLVTQTG